MKKRTNKLTFWLVLIVIAAFAYSVGAGVKYYHGDIDDIYIKGAKDIRLGIDIQGGVDVTFKPDLSKSLTSASSDGTAVGSGGATSDGGAALGEDFKASKAQIDSVAQVMKVRLASQNISDSEVYADYNNDSVIVRFPWQAGETDFDPEAAVNELGQTAVLRFIEGTEYDLTKVALTGEHVKSAKSQTQQDETTGSLEYVVALEFDSEGTKLFGETTTRIVGSQMSIWMDENCLSAPTVQAALTDGKAIISGSFTAETSKELADQINSGALPFSLTTASFKTISPTLGAGALDSMLLSSLIALVLVCIYMIIMYRLQGMVASIAVIGQISGTLAFVSGWFGFMNSSTLTIPGIAGIILAAGMGLDTNIITGERIKEEINSGKPIDTALRTAYKRAFTAIFDGNLTTIIVTIVLMGAFGVPDSPFAKMLNFIFFPFGVTTEGAIYSFGYTLLCGVVLNFVMGVFASRLMLFSLSKYKIGKNRKHYGIGIK
jgi:preprotein translocase subunit SecD/SecD/SecF fusion protein